MAETANYPSLNNKTVIITGGAQGIGESIVEQFITQNSKVAFLDIDENAGKALVKKINQVLNKTYITKKQRNNGTFHYRGDLPIFMKKNWQAKIKNILKIYKR